MRVLRSWFGVFEVSDAVKAKIRDGKLHKSEVTINIQVKRCRFSADTQPLPQPDCGRKTHCGEGGEGGGSVRIVQAGPGGTLWISDPELRWSNH